MPVSSFRCQLVTDVLRVPIKYFCGAQNAESREGHVSAADMILVRRSKLNGQTFDTIVCLARSEAQAPVILLTKDRPDVHRGVGGGCGLLRRGCAATHQEGSDECCDADVLHDVIRLAELSGEREPSMPRRFIRRYRFGRSVLSHRAASAMFPD